jgi:hypothetical protein
MPLRLNVGASQKIADGRYGSRGASVNVEVELDSFLVLEPDKLQERMRQLFGIVRQSVSEELAGPSAKADAPRPSDKADAAASPELNSSNLPRPATSRQVKALYAIAKEQGFDLLERVRDCLGVARPEDLSLQQASELITALKAQTPSSAA